MSEKFETHLFEYQHDGATWTVEIKATSEEDTLARVRAMQRGNYLGVGKMQIPVELGVFARLVCWWKNRRPA